MSMAPLVPRFDPRLARGRSPPRTAPASAGGAPRPARRRTLVEEREIEEILGSSARTLVPPVVAEADHLNAVGAERSADAVLPRRRERDARDLGEDIDPHRFAPKPQHSVRYSEVLPLRGALRKPELSEDGADPASVGPGRLDEQIEIERRAWAPVDRQRVGPDQQEPHAMTQQQADELAPVGGEIHLRTLRGSVGERPRPRQGVHETDAAPTRWPIPVPPPRESTTAPRAALVPVYRATAPAAPRRRRFDAAPTTTRPSPAPARSPTSARGSRRPPRPRIRAAAMGLAILHRGPDPAAVLDHDVMEACVRGRARPPRGSTTTPRAACPGVIHPLAVLVYPAGEPCRRTRRS